MTDEKKPIQCAYCDGEIEFIFEDGFSTEWAWRCKGCGVASLFQHPSRAEAEAHAYGHLGALLERLAHESGFEQGRQFWFMEDGMLVFVHSTHDCEPNTPLAAVQAALEAAEGEGDG